MRTLHIIAIIVALVALVPAAALGQVTKLYVAGSDSGHVWAFAGLAPIVLNHGHPFIGVRDMAIGSDGRVLVADSDFKISALDPHTGDVEYLLTRSDPLEVFPDGESADIYFVAGDSTSLWVLPGGTAPAESCVSFPGPVLDLLVFPSGPSKGHLAVLFGARGDTPPYIAEFERTGPTSFNELSPIVEEATSDAVDLAFRPDGNLVLLDGSLGLYNVSPTGELTHFGPGFIAPGADDLDIGSNGVIYVANAAACVIYRLSMFGQVISPNLELGHGCPIALVALGFTPTPPGANVLVNPAEPVQLLLESVADGGYSSAVLTETPSRTSPRGNTLPDYAGLPDGETEFTYIYLSTTAAYEDLIQTDALLPGTRLFAVSSDGTRGGFADATVEGSIEDARGVISRFDEVVCAVDNRPVGAVADHKFGRLYEILEPLEGEPPGLTAVRAELEVHADEALSYYGSYLYDWAIDELSVMNGVIRGYAGDEIPNSPDDPLGNVAGEMLSRSKTLMFTLSFLEPPTDVPAPDADAGGSYSLACASPARSECRLELAGPAAARVAVTLCTTGGRLVKTLHDGAFAGGRLALVWDGTDDSGRRVASGVYMTRVESGESLATGKVVFIR